MIPFHEKSPCARTDTEGESASRYHLVFTALSGTASGYFHILCAVSGAPGSPTPLSGFRSQLRRVFRLYSSGRLAPPGGSLYRIPVCLLGLLHRTAMVVRNPIPVNTLNNERTIPLCATAPSPVYPPPTFFFPLSTSYLLPELSPLSTLHSPLLLSPPLFIMNSEL